MPVMSPACGRVAVLLVLVAWVLAGPIGMAVSCCATMCEGSCATGTPSLEAQSGASIAPRVAAAVDPLIGTPPSAALRVLEPPPKLPLSA